MATLPLKQSSTALVRGGARFVLTSAEHEPGAVEHKRRRAREPRVAVRGELVLRAAVRAGQLDVVRAFGVVNTHPAPLVGRLVAALVGQRRQAGRVAHRSAVLRGAVRGG